MAIFCTFNNTNSSRQFLNHFSLLRLLVVFWLVKTYQHGCHPSVLIHHAPGTAECDESYCIEGGPYLVVLSSGCVFFYHESYCNESVIMTIYGFLNIQFFCDVSSGLGLCPYMEHGCVYGLIWFPPSLLGFLECIKCPLPYYLRQTLSKFRICYHRLQIEVGQWLIKERNQEKKRTCIRCTLNNIDEEVISFLIVKYIYTMYLCI